MKRIIALFLLALSLIFIIQLPVKAAELDLVFDEVDLLTDNEYLELNELAKKITDQYQFEVSIVVMDDKEDEDVIEFANFVYEEYDYGYGEDKNGTMLLISMKDRDCGIVTNGYGDIAFSDYGKEILLDRYVLPLLSQGKYYDGFLTYLNQSEEFLKMAKDGAPFSRDTDEALTDNGVKSSFATNLAITILVPLFIAGIICFIFLGQMKTAVPQQAASYYISEGSLNLTKEVDKFLHRTETRTPIEKKSASGGTSAGSTTSSGGKGKF